MHNYQPLADMLGGLGEKLSHTPYCASREEGRCAGSETYSDMDGQSCHDRSPTIALGLARPFHQYLFIKNSKKRIEALKKVGRHPAHQAQHQAARYGSETPLAAKRLDGCERRTRACAQTRVRPEARSGDGEICLM